MIRLIALDLDQTTFGSDLQVAPEVSGAIRQAQAAGLVVTIATGREAGLAARFARELEITAPIVCAQGACIFDHVRGRVLHEVRLAREMLPRILEAARQYRWNIHFETSDRLYFPKDSKHPRALFELVRYSNWVRVGDLLTDMPTLPYKVIVTLGRTEERERTIGEMRVALGESLTIVPSHPHLVEALPQGVDKGHGVAWLAEHLGMRSDEVMAIGDSEADLPMIEWAGFGVAMGNASDSVKAAADWVAPSLEHHGVAAAIAKALDEGRSRSRD